MPYIPPNKIAIHTAIRYSFLLLFNTNLYPYKLSSAMSN